MAIMIQRMMNYLLWPYIPGINLRKAKTFICIIFQIRVTFDDDSGA